MAVLHTRWDSERDLETNDSSLSRRQADDLKTPLRLHRRVRRGHIAQDIFARGKREVSAAIGVIGNRPYEWSGARNADYTVFAPHGRAETAKRSTDPHF